MKGIFYSFSEKETAKRIQKKKNNKRRLNVNISHSVINSYQRALFFFVSHIGFFNRGIRNVK